MPYRQAAQDLLAAKTAAGITALGALLSWDASTALVGVPLNVLLASLTGALLGIAYGDPIAPRRRLLKVALANAFLAASISALLPHVPLFGWLGKAPAAAVGLVLGFVARWGIPALQERVPALVRGLAARLGAKDTPKGNDP
jgi:hypothetical protein